MLRNIGFGLLGFLVFTVFVLLGDSAAGKISPPPAGFDASDHEALRAFASTMPSTALWIMLLAHAIGSFAGGWVVGRWTGAVRTATIVALLMLAGGVWNLVDIPHPTWFWADGLTYLPMAWLGFNMGRSLRNG